MLQQLCFGAVLLLFAINGSVLYWQLTRIESTRLSFSSSSSSVDAIVERSSVLPGGEREALYDYVNWLEPRFDEVRIEAQSLRDEVKERKSEPSARRRICIVAWEYEELIVHGGGIGTAFTALARSLAHAGHNVTVLVNRADPVDYTAMLSNGWDEWRTLILTRDNVSLHEPRGGIYALDKARDRCGFACVWSYVAFRWLADRDGQFDIVHFHDNAAFGYFSILARQQLRYFAHTLLVVGAHGPHFWERKANRIYLTDTYNLEADYMERYMARWCDYLVAPSQFIVDWMWRNDWRLAPARVRVWQNIMPVSKLVLERRLALAQQVRNNTAFFDGPKPQRDAALALDDAELPSGCATTECAAAHALAPRATARIVFFGRHETRKGLGVFLDAVRRINATLVERDIQLVFLGSMSLVDGQASEEFISRRCAEANLACVQLTDLGRTAAAEQLAVPNTLTVVASLTENSPYTVLECLGKPLPFIATRVGGIPELIAAADRDRVLFEPTAVALAQRIVDVLEHGLVPARYAVTPAETERVWIEWHGTVPIRPLVDPLPPLSQPLPSVVVCVAHQNAADFLALTVAAALEAAAQYSGDVAVIVADAGSEQAEARAALERIERSGDARQRVLRLDASAQVGDARNACAVAAKGSKYVVFADAGDVVLPGALTTLVEVAERRNLTVVTAPSTLMRARNHTDEIEVYVGCGEHGDGMALYHNCYGSTASLMRRDAFLRAGGFRRDEFGVDDATHALFATMILLDGARLEACACAVQFRRHTHEAQLALPRFGVVPDEFVRRTRQLRPFLGALPPALRAVGMFSLDMYQTVREIEAKKKRWYADRFAKVQNALNLLLDFYEQNKNRTYSDKL